MSAKNFLKWLSLPQEQSEVITYADAEMDAWAIEAVKTAIAKAKFCKKPVAKYDIEKNRHIWNLRMEGENMLNRKPTGCVDCKTEYFNGHEWKSIADYTDGEQVLQFDVDTGEASLVTPECYIKEPCEKMYRFETLDGLNQVLSPEHRMLYYDNERKPHVILAEELYRRYQRCGGFDGKFLTTFGWHLNENEEKDLNIDIDDIYNDIYNTFTLEEQFSSEWYRLPRMTMAAICCVPRRGDPLKRKAFADFLQFILTMGSFAMKVYKGEDHCYYLRPVKQYAAFDSDTVIAEVTPSDGYKYCFSVPSTFLVLRRNGHIFVTGNSGKSS